MFVCLLDCSFPFCEIMQQALRHEAEYFDEKKRLLRAIFNETLSQCVDAYRSKNVPKDKYQEICLKSDDERYIRSMLDNPISIVLLGNRPCVKARIANYILGYELLPVFDYFDPDYKQARRSVRIMFGTQRRHAFCIRHFELIECQPSYTERIVSFDDLRLDPIGTTTSCSSPSATSSNCGSSSEPASIATTVTSGHGSSSMNGAIGDQSSTATTISFSSSSSSAAAAAAAISTNRNQIPPQPPPSAATTATGAASSTYQRRPPQQQSHPLLNRSGGTSSSAFSSNGGLTSAFDYRQHPTTMMANTNHNGTTNHTKYTNRYHRSNNPYDDDDDEVDENDYGEVDSVNEMTTLEIVLPHELLEKNLQIRVAPDVDNFDIIYRSTFYKTNPIIMYCFERYDDRLTDVDISHLDQLRQLMPSSPILFAHINDFDPSYHSCVVSPLHQQPHHKHNMVNNHNTNHQQQQQQLQSSPSSTSSNDQTIVQCQCSSSSTSTITPTPGGGDGNTNIRSDLTESQQHSVHPNTNRCCTINVESGALNNRYQTSPQSSSLSATKTKQCSDSIDCDMNVNGKCINDFNNGTYLQACESLWRQLAEMGFFQESASSSAILQAPLDRQQKRLSNGYYIINDRPFKCAKQNADHGIDVRSRFLCHSYEFCYFVDFFRAILKSNLVVASTLLNEIHNLFIQYFIFTAFDMTWSLNHSIPKRLEYAKSKEAELYMHLMGIANRKQDEIRSLIGEMVDFMREDILEQASNYTFSNPALNRRARQPEMITANNLKDCIDEIQDFVFVMLNRAIAVKLISSVDMMRETFIGTLQRCLAMLESSRPKKENEKLRQEDKIDFALSRLLDSAYSIEINVHTCNSILRIFWQRMKQLFVSFTFAWRPNCALDGEWKRKVASDLINNLSEAKLAKCICMQFRDKLKVAHDNFVSSLANLESVLNHKMKDTDSRRNQVRKNDAPLFARLALESTSFIDAILYGIPELSKEIGRGQYGVVFSTKKSWANYSRIAVKSIMICDDKHWNDLAMEFYYARSLPENERIVQIRGSIIEHNYNGSSSYVYLVMERLTRDLYAGLKSGLDWVVRLQIALDVVHGLRFLHNHGLIHRDIKLKNVLLDKHNRAKITDLGFCKSEVMISGSIVGTPIHMAPEVFTGKYDSMVDVYAFGILFWYICAGSVELPQIFEQCHNKDHLWIAVKKGLRPERLPIFNDQCFNLMERCWSGDTNRRPILGEVETIINQIKDQYINSH